MSLRTLHLERHAPADDTPPVFLNRRHVDGEPYAWLDGVVYVFTFAWRGKEYEVDESGNLESIDGHETHLWLEPSHPLHVASQDAATR